MNLGNEIILNPANNFQPVIVITSMLNNIIIEIEIYYEEKYSDRDDTIFKIKESKIIRSVPLFGMLGQLTRLTI